MRLRVVFFVCLLPAGLRSNPHHPQVVWTELGEPLGCVRLLGLLPFDPVMSLEQTGRILGQVVVVIWLEQRTMGQVEDCFHRGTGDDLDVKMKSCFKVRPVKMWCEQRDDTHSKMNCHSFTFVCRQLFGMYAVRTISGVSVCVGVRMCVYMLFFFYCCSCISVFLWLNLCLKVNKLLVCDELWQMTNESPPSIKYIAWACVTTAIMHWQLKASLQ